MKQLFFHSLIILITLSVCQSCKDRETSKTSIIHEAHADDTFDYFIDVSAIPIDTIAFTNSNLTYINGLYLLQNKPYSGIVYTVLKGYDVKTYSSVLNGKLHGTYRSFYDNGKPYEIRYYRNGLAIGTHVAYWKSNGNLKFEYNYYDQKKEGSHKNWFENGNLSYSYRYKNDRLFGLQQAWRINGSLYRNFIVKNGVRYGLQKAKSCYELSNETVVTQASKNKKTI
ncbi:toxin-antitoxin system YwqK family antitoxin [Formosa algae]|uniref:toxin-antitoxin system YwqK family antitoxin n=1 Tax=Formosa algae TaxID=225843 RepID=UPI000CCE3FD4|nr:hypothetical protein [Formosa algae]PNW26539.1 hypothetical protein BKP44_16535 [Formosa algae]